MVKLEQNSKSKEVFKVYNETPFVTGTKDANGKKRAYKFRSPLDFVDFIQECYEKKINFSGQFSSQERGSSWAGSENMEEAIKKFREAKYDSSNSKKNNGLIVQMRQGVKLIDSGDEILMPEYLGKSQEYFIEYIDRRRKKTPTLKHPIIISLSVSCAVDQRDMEKVTNTIISTLYENKVRTPNIVMAYISQNIDSSGKTLYSFTNIPYFDFNSLKRYTFTSTFRRLDFATSELVEGLAYGYGQPLELEEPKTLHDVISVARWTSSSEKSIKEKVVKLINNTFN